MNIEERLKKVLKRWVKDMYGESEAEDPSWDIGGLARFLAYEFHKIEYDVETLNITDDVKEVAFDNDVELTDEELKLVVDQYRKSDAYCELNRPCIEYLIERVKGEV